MTTSKENAVRVYDASGVGRNVSNKPEYKGEREPSKKRKRVLANVTHKGEKLRPALKYVVIGGLVRSHTDGQLHRVSAAQLVELYRLDPKECVLCEDDEEARYNLLGVEPGQLITLRPRYDGNYTLFTNHNEASCAS